MSERRLSRSPIASLIYGALSAFALVSGCSCGDDPDPQPTGDKPVIKNFTANPAMVASGGKTTLTWEVTGADTITIVATPGGTLVDKGTAATGTIESAALTANTAFVLTATNEAGAATRTINVDITATPTDVRVVRFDVTPATIASGEMVTIDFQTENATRVTVAVVNGANLHDSTTVFSGTLNDSPTVTTSYVITAEGPNGPRSQTKTVMVQNTPVINTFTANPTMIEQGEMSTLSWDVADAATITIRDSANNEVYTGADATGSRMVSPQANETYTLTAESSTGQMATPRTVMVTVNAAARIDRFVVTPNTVTYGDSARLEWTVSRATSVEIRAFGQTVTSSMALTGSFTVTATRTTEYTLIARAPGGDSMAMTTLTVNPAAPRVTTFDATPNPALIGTPSRLHWATLGATTIRVTDATGAVVYTGSDADFTVDVTVTASTATYELTARNPFGVTTAQVVLTGRNVPQITAFTVSPTTFATATSSVTVEYSTNEADAVALFINGVAAPGFPAAQLDGTFTFTTTQTVVVRLEASNPFGLDQEQARVLRLANAPENGNDATTAFPLPANGGATGEITSGDSDFYSFTVPANGNVSVTISDGAGGCNFDTLIALMGTDGTTVLGTDDDGGPDACSAIDPVVNAFAANLAAGTYYVRVRGYDATEVGTYAVVISVNGPACANRILERGANEQCDDGNTTAGDGCTGTCTIEPAGTVAGPGQNGNFTAAIDVNGRERWYRIDMAAEGYIDAQTYVATAPNCTAAPGASADTVLTLYTAAFAELGSDNDDGAGPCAAIDPRFDAFAHVQAGTYWLRVTENGNNAIIPSLSVAIRTLGAGCGNGIIETGETCDDANGNDGDGCSAVCGYEGIAEVEPNNAFGTATVVTGTVAIVSGSIGQVGDVDFFRITVPAGSNLDVQVTVGGFDACPSGVTAQLQLLGTNGTTSLATNSTGGAGGNCGRLWYYSTVSSLGTNGAAGTPATRGLAAGDYYIRVNELGDNAALASYFLNIRILPNASCGNTVFETGEACDDGNTTNGDGCSSTCRLEPTATVTLPVTGTATVAVVVDPYYQRASVALNVTAPVYVSAETLNDLAARSCSVDTYMRLFGTDGVTQLGLNDDDGTGNCSFIDPAFDAFARLTPGTYLLSVEDYLQNNALGTVQVLVRSVPADVCGNGVAETAINETCDDGNQVAGDGCSPTCAIEPDFTFTAAAGATQTFTGTLDPADDVDIVQINVTGTVYLRAETFAPTSPACATADSVIRLFNATGTQLGTDDEDGVGSCSLITRTTDGFARLTAGTYFLTIEDYELDDVLGAYQIVMSAAAADVCGDGILESAANEQCDDSNTTSGDGCSATCQLEIAATVPVPGPAYTLNDSITPATNVDAIQLNVTQTSYVRAEVFSTVYPDCSGGADPLIRLLNATTGAVVGTDNDDGRNACALLNPNVDTFMRLAPGQYYLSIEENGRNAVIANYQLRVTSVAVDVCGNGVVETNEQCDDSNTAAGDGCSTTCQLDAATAEVEPNSTQATAQASVLSGAGVTTLTGAINPTGDSDYYTFVVPAGAQRLSLRARTYSAVGNPASTCNDTVDTRIRLYNAAGTLLEDNDDIAGSSNRCSFIDGIGNSITGTASTPDTDPAARNLAPGTYTVRVSYYSDTTAGTTGTYYLQLQLVQE